jgi:hypothetical protein
MRSKQIIKLILGFLFLLIQINTQAQQAAYEQYGQNRVQYRNFKWNYYDTTHFRVMYYDQGKFNAQFLLQQAEIDLAPIVFMMGARFQQKIDIVLYNSFSDYLQTNIGKYNDDLNNTTNGRVEINRNTVAIFFDGTHDGMRKQMRKGITKIIRDNLLFGYTMKEIVTNAAKLNLPEWFTSGYVDYVALDWDADKLARLRSYFAKNAKLEFDDLKYKDATLVGHSFFNFVAHNYNENAINNLLFLARAGKNISTAIQTVFKIDEEAILELWKDYYAIPYDSTLVDTAMARNYVTRIKSKPDVYLKQFSISPDATILCYTEVKDGKYKIKLLNLKNNKAVTILDGGVRNSVQLKDPNYPIVAWSIDGGKAAILYEQDYLQRLKIYDTKKGRTINKIIPRKKFDRITGMSFMEDDNQLVLSAIRKGQSDIYKYTLASSQIFQITKDIWDDISPTFIQSGGRQGVAFLSNRPTQRINEPLVNNELPNTPLKLFYLDDINGMGLRMMSKNVSLPVSQPIQYGSNRLAMLVEKDGSKQRYIVNINNEYGRDSFMYTKSNAIDYNITYQNGMRKTNTVLEIIEKAGHYYIYHTQIKHLDTMDTFRHVEPVGILKPPIKDTVKLINKKEPDIYILSEFINDIDSVQPDEPEKDPLAFDPIKDSILRNQKPKKFKSRPYKYLFTRDYMQTSFDNSLLFNRYQKINMGNGSFQNPPSGALFRFGVLDVKEDYKISAGVRLPFNLSPRLAYFAQFGNYRKKIDWEISYYHNSDTLIKDNRFLDPKDKYYSQYLEYAKVSQNYLQLRLIYPFSITSSIRLETGLRTDIIRYKAQTEYSLGFDSYTEFWNINKLEYVYDNTIKTFPNIRKGTRVKVYTDAFIETKKGGGNLFNIGLDARNYIGLYKNIILASRVSYATSMGKTRMLYKVGGIDNEIVPNYNNFIPTIDTSVTYGYQTIVTNLRGHTQNARNGDTYMLLNEELRIPVINTFTDRQFKSKFINNLQLVFFFDLAQVGMGPTAEGDDFRYTTTTIKNGVTITNAKISQPVMMGYGYGIRTQILGHFAHIDVGYNNTNRKPRWSIGTEVDF